MAERPHLTRDAVLETGLRLADAEGLEALSLRRIARELGVTPMALYRYVADKDDLLDGIADLVIGKLELDPAEQAPWQDRLRVAARSYRQLLLAHPAAVTLFSTRPSPTPNVFRVMEALLALLELAGFEPEEAATLYGHTARFVLGIVALETAGSPPSRSEADAAELAETVRAQLASLPADRYPHIVQAAPIFTTRHDSERSFEIGLDILVAGLEALLARKGASGS